MEEVHHLAPNIVVLGDRRWPTIRSVTTHRTRRPADLWLLMQGSEDQNMDKWRQFSGWCPVFWGLAGAFAWGVGDSFRKICTSPIEYRSCAVTT